MRIIIERQLTISNTRPGIRKGSVQVNQPVTFNISQTDSGKYQLSIRYITNEGVVKYEQVYEDCRFRALTIQELVPLSIKSLPAELGQPLRDLVYDADDIEYTRLQNKILEDDKVLSSSKKTEEALYPKPPTPEGAS